MVAAVSKQRVLDRDEYPASYKLPGVGAWICVLLFNTLFVLPMLGVEIERALGYNLVLLGVLGSLCYGMSWSSEIDMRDGVDPFQYIYMFAAGGFVGIAAMEHVSKMDWAGYSVPIMNMAIMGSFFGSVVAYILIGYPIRRILNG